MPITGCIWITITFLSCCATAGVNDAITAPRAAVLIKMDLSMYPPELMERRSGGLQSNKISRTVGKANNGALSSEHALRARQGVGAIRPETQAPLCNPHRIVHEKADDAEYKDHGKQRSRLQRLIVLHQQHAEPGAGTDEFTDDGAEDRQDRGDAEAGEQKRQRTRDDNLREDMPLAGVAGLRQFDPLRLDRMIARHGIHQHREKRDDRGDEHLAVETEAEPDDH